jgi:hypothetical protein
MWTKAVIPMAVAALVLGPVVDFESDFIMEEKMPLKVLVYEDFVGVPASRPRHLSPFGYYCFWLAFSSQIKAKTLEDRRMKEMMYWTVGQFMEAVHAEAS